MKALHIGVWGVLICCLVIPPVWAGEAATSDESDGTYEVNADQLDSDWNHQAGEITTRFGLDFTAAAGLGGDDGFSVADDLAIGLAAGAGYFPIDQLSADLDLGGTLTFADSNIDFSAISLTPGAHYYPISEVFLRLGVPFIVTDPSSVNVLGGIGYEYPLNDSQTLVGEIDLTYPLTGDGSGFITVGGGTTFSL